MVPSVRGIFGTRRGLSTVKGGGELPPLCGHLGGREQIVKPTSKG